MDSFGITSVPGIRVGHYTNREAATGCTVVLCDRGAVGGVDVRGSAPGTRETDLLHPTNAYLNTEQTNKLASVAHDGLAMAVRPAHMMSDGDVLFSLATGEIDRPVNMNRLCAAAVCASVLLSSGVSRKPKVWEAYPASRS